MNFVHLFPLPVLKQRGLHTEDFDENSSLSITANNYPTNPN